jgi:hypothetical protein
MVNRFVKYDLIVLDAWGFRNRVFFTKRRVAARRLAKNPVSLVGVRSGIFNSIQEHPHTKQRLDTEN